MINSQNMKKSFVELNGRERAQALSDEGTFRELLGPFDNFESPHLEKQGIVPQSDDGVIVARAKIAGKDALIISLEGEFQGGGIGEVSGAKISGALELALVECKKGNLIAPVILYDTGGVRLQEANYGLLSIAEIHSAIVALREYVPVTAIIPGKVGAYGGMSITVGLCSSIIMTKEARLSLNGPEVIETEAGVAEFDSKDRIKIWQATGGEQRVAANFADKLVADDISEIKEATVNAIDAPPSVARPEQIEFYLNALSSFNPNNHLSPLEARKLFSNNPPERIKLEEVDKSSVGRGMTWFNCLTDNAFDESELSTVRVAEHDLLGEKAVFIAIVPDSKNNFPRVRSGEVGLKEGWTVAKAITEVVEADKDNQIKRPIIAIVDVPSQAYGYNEELLGIHQSLAASVNAYAKARLAGHPVVAFIPGLAISGAFLSHGMQANRIIALSDPGVNVHVMSKASAALITQRTIAELEEATKDVPAMAYDVESFESLGALSDLITGINADSPTEADLMIIVKKIKEAIKDIRENGTDLSNRLTSKYASESGRIATNQVRKKLEEQWN